MFLLYLFQLDVDVHNLWFKLFIQRRTLVLNESFEQLYNKSPLLCINNLSFICFIKCLIEIFSELIEALFVTFAILTTIKEHGHHDFCKFTEILLKGFFLYKSAHHLHYRVKNALCENKVVQVNF